jgi:uncharacterized protein (TIGR04255 family)
MPKPPTKLKHDAITEAVFEVRFSPNVPVLEIILGNLAQKFSAQGFTAERLPAADIPTPLRLSDQTMLFAPLIDMKAPSGTSSVRIGTHVVICVVNKPYCGWDEFHALHTQAVNALFEVVAGVEVVRLGLRYINTVTESEHKVKSIADLRLAVRVGDANLVDNYNLNFRVFDNPETECMIRVATKEFTTPQLQPPGHTVIDIDVSTPVGFRTREKDRVMAWLPNARAVKNDAFFNMFSADQIKALQEN